MAMDRKAVLDLVVKVSGEASLGNLAKGLDKVQKSAKGQGASGLENLAKGAGKALLAITAITGVVGGALNGLMAMGDEGAMLEAQMRAASVQFGSSFKTIVDWATKSAGAMGLTSRELIALSTTTQAALVQTGLTDAKATQLTVTFGKLAGSLSYATGGFYDVAQTTDMIQAAFRGEYDALQRLIPGISNARLQAVALRIAHKDGKKAVDAYSITMATLGILQRDGARYIKLYKASQDSSLVSINKSKAAMREQWQDLEIRLLPAFVNLWKSLSTQVVPAVSDFIDYLQSPGGKQSMVDWVNTLGTLGSVVGGVARAVSSLIQTQMALVNTFGPLISGAWNAIGPLHELQVVLGGVASLMNMTRPVTGSVAVPHVTRGVSDMTRNIVDPYAGVDFSAPMGSSRKKGSGGGGGGKKYDDPDLEHLKDKVTKNLDVVQKAFEVHKQALDDLKSKYSEVSGSVRDSFLGAALTGRGSSYAANMASYGESLARGRSFLGALKKLKGLGLSNTLLSQLASEGPNALEQAVSILASGRSGIGAMNNQASALAAISNQAGKYIGDTLYAASIKSQTAETAKLSKAVASLEKALKSVEKQISSGGNISSAQVARALMKILRQAGATGVNGVVKR